MEFVEEIEALLRGYLPYVTCAACAADIRAGVDPARFNNDPGHCFSCLRNIPTYIELARKAQLIRTTSPTIKPASLPPAEGNIGAPTTLTRVTD